MGPALFAIIPVWQGQQAAQNVRGAVSICKKHQQQLDLLAAERFDAQIPATPCQRLQHAADACIKVRIICLLCPPHPQKLDPSTTPYQTWSALGGEFDSEVASCIIVKPGKQGC